MASTPVRPDTWELEDFASALPEPGQARPFRAVGERHLGPLSQGGYAPPAAPRASTPPMDPAAMRAQVMAEVAAQHRADIAAAERRGHDAGYREGAAQAGEAAHAALRPLCESLENALASLREHEQRFLGNLQENTVAVALAVARVIVDREVNADIAIVEELVRRALNEFPLDQPVRVRVHPEDLELLMDGASAQAGAAAPHAERWDPRRELSWLPDPLVARGGAVLEGRERIVDGRVDTGLERVFRRLCHVT